MKKTKVYLKEMNVLGVCTRTNNKNEFNPETAKIGNIAKQYGENHLASNIPERRHPNVTLAGYTHYASDEHGDYTYFIGEEVLSNNNCPNGFSPIIIPPGTYVKFTTEAGKMPDIVVNAWMKIWQMSAADLGGTRNYRVDFELYDDRASDPNSMIVDIYIGIDD